MSLTWKILLLILFTISFSTFSNYLLTDYQAKTLHNDSEKILAHTIVNSLRDAIVQDVINNNKLKVSNLLKNIVQYDNPIQYLYVTSSNHKIFAHSYDNGFPRYLLHQQKSHPETSGVHLLNKYQTNQGLIFEYSEALLPGLETTLHIGINQSVIANKLASNKQTILLLSGAILLLSVIIALYLSRQITTPLSAFAQHIHSFGKGEKFKFTESKSSIPEITELAHAMQIASTERKNALEIAFQRERNLSITLNSIGDAVITTDEHGHVNRMNPVAERLTGWNNEEAKGQSLKNIFQIINASTREPIDNPIDKVMSSGEIVYLSNHTTLISRNATEYQIADSAAPIRDEDDNILGMVLVFNDVTEQYKLRQAAADSKNNMQSIMDNSPAVIYVKDIEGRFTFVNKKFTDLFKMPHDKVIGHSLHDIFPQDIADEMKKNDLDVLETGHSLESEEIVPQDGELHTFISTKFPLRDKENKIYAICGISTDVTDKKLKEEQLRRSQKMDALGKLTGGIAHDFNNMLGVILGYSELLSHVLGKDEKTSSYIREIQKAGERGAKLTNKLLSFSRQKASDSKAHDINRLLSEQTHMLEKTLTARITLKTELADNLWQVLLDSSDLVDAIVNISINAMHAIKGNGQLTIRTYNESVNKTDADHLGIEPGDYVLLSITDSGAGMDRATKERIFDPFFSTKGDQGTGLGLSQVYGFVENSNGTIKVYSEPGHGTRFTLYFPRNIDADTTEISSTNPVENKSNLHGTETILIVDDEPALLKLTSKILLVHGYKTFTAENGKYALEILDNEHIDLVLSDVIMPEMDGYELATIILKEHPEIKIQMASGFSDDRHENFIDDSLHENLLHKPYHSATLLKRLRELLD